MSAFQSLLPTNATALERALEQAGARAFGLPVQHASLYNAQTCPAHLLGWLAWALSVDEWDTAWTEPIKRETVRRTPQLHQRKGTMWSIKEALKPLATQTGVVEWWQEEPVGQPGTFKVRTNIKTDTAVIGEADVVLIKRVIGATKPVSRAHSLAVQVSMTAHQRPAAIARPIQYVRLLSFGGSA